MYNIIITLLAGKWERMCVLYTCQHTFQAICAFGFWQDYKACFVVYHVPFHGRMPGLCVHIFQPTWMCVCAFVCVYVYLCVCLCVYVCVYRIYMHVYIHMLYIYIYIYIYIYVHAYACMCAAHPQVDMFNARQDVYQGSPPPPSLRLSLCNRRAQLGNTYVCIN